MRFTEWLAVLLSVTCTCFYFQVRRIVVVCVFVAVVHFLIRPEQSSKLCFGHHAVSVDVTIGP